MIPFVIIGALIAIFVVLYVVYLTVNKKNQEKDTIGRTILYLSLEQAIKLVTDINFAKTKVEEGSKRESVKFFIDEANVIQIDICKEV